MSVLPGLKKPLLQGSHAHAHDDDDHGHSHGSKIAQKDDHGHSHNGDHGHSHGSKNEDHGHSHGSKSKDDHGHSHNGDHGHSHGSKKDDHGHSHGNHGPSQSNSSHNHAHWDEPDPISEKEDQIRRLKYAIYLALIFMIAEIIGGFVANSIAIMTDAAHMLSDVGGFIVSLFALGYTSKKANRKRSYGYHQAEVLGALISLCMVWLLTGALLLEAIKRIQNIQEINGEIMFIVATFGLLVNLVLMRVLGHGHSHGGGHGHSHGGGHGHSHGGGHDHGHGGHGGEEEGSGSLALDAATAHVLGDLVQSVGVMLAGLCIWQQPWDIGQTSTGVSNWNYMDPVCTFIFALLVLLTTKGPLLGIVDNLMFATPKNIEPAEVKRALEEIENVVCIHDIHIWMVGQVPCFTCHTVVKPGSDFTKILDDHIEVLREQFKLEHVTIQQEIDGEFDHSKESYGGLHRKDSLYNVCCRSPEHRNSRGSEVV